MKKNKNAKKSKLSLDDLKKKGNVHNETLEAISGGLLGLGAGEVAAPSSKAIDGDKNLPR